MQPSPRPTLEHENFPRFPASTHVATENIPAKLSRMPRLMPQQLQRVEEALHDRLTKRRVDGVYGIIKLVDERAAGAVQFVHGRG